MKYELKIVDKPGGLQVLERYKTISGETIEAVVLISTALSATLVTMEMYGLLSNEPTTLMENEIDYRVPYVPLIQYPERGTIKGFTLGGKPAGDIPVIVCDCKIGYPNQIILGTDVLLMRCRQFSVDKESLIIETRD